MKKADNARSVFYLHYDDGTDFVSRPCRHLDEAIVQSGYRERPITADFLWGDIMTPCTQDGIDRAMASMRLLRRTAIAA